MVNSFWRANCNQWYYTNHRIVFFFSKKKKTDTRLSNDFWQVHAQKMLRWNFFQKIKVREWEKRNKDKNDKMKVFLFLENLFRFFFFKFPDKDCAWIFHVTTSILRIFSFFSFLLPTIYNFVCSHFFLSNFISKNVSNFGSFVEMKIIEINKKITKFLLFFKYIHISMHC